jgi:hypothetical protein
MAAAIYGYLQVLKLMKSDFFGCFNEDGDGFSGVLAAVLKF